LYVSEATLQLSDAAAAKETLSVQRLLSALTVMLAGQVMVGGCVSTTVTRKVQVATLLQLSAAPASTVVVPKGKVCGLVICVLPIT
jgi:hypothetical protein